MYPYPVLFFNQEEVLKVIKILRGNNDVSDNCTHVSSDLIEYFKTGIIPDNESSTIPSTLEDFDVVTVSDWIKKENGSKYIGMVKSIVCLNNTKISNIPCDTIPKQLDDGILDLESIYDVDNFTQFTSSIDNINISLNKKAKENEKGISFGFICIGRCGKYINMAGHMLVYFSTDKNVWYIDCQLYDGINKIDNGCIFNDLQSTFQFANSKRITIDVFGEYVFYIPIDHRTQFNEKLLIVKSEEIYKVVDTNHISNIKIQQKDNKCEHNRRRSTCKDCKGSSRCEHDRIKSTCKDCKGRSVCPHDRRRSACKECGGGSRCEHDRLRSVCKECGGSSRCQHDRIRSVCKECGGGSRCQHDRIRSTCKDCKGGARCEHDRVRSICKDCKGGARCEHDRVRSICKDCKGGARCEHDRIRTKCKDCKGGSICKHNRVRSICKECGGKGLCVHGRQKSLCLPCGGSSICEHGKRRCRCTECKLIKKRKFEDNFTSLPLKKSKIL
jgi:hypothetical protein